MNQLDLDVLGWVNQYLASSETLFTVALVGTNQIPWLIASTIIVFYWFSKGEDSVFSYRKDMVLVVTCSLLAFMLAKPLAHYIGHVRPLVDLSLLHTLHDGHWKKLVRAFEHSSSTPNDLASFLWAFSVAMFFVRKKIAALMVVVTLSVCFLAVGIGYLYPSDVMYSLLFGGSLSLVFFLMRDYLQVFCQWVLACFEFFPVLAYPAAFMLLYDMNHHMAFFQYILKLIFGIEVLQ
ncbi:MAG: hypothetical protein Q9M28_09545 [Mariprofundaceae bacterium]|nr:hypothetical protein [Mariprofundaceae bacterium]